MCKDKFVLTMTEETQGLIINALLSFRELQLKEGKDIGWIGDAIIDVCNAPKRKNRLLGDDYER